VCYDLRHDVHWPLGQDVLVCPTRRSSIVVSLLNQASCLDTVDSVLIETEYIQPLDSYRATDGDCWRVCTDGVSNCGGSMRFAVFGPPDPPPTSPGVVGEYEGWTYEGCYTDHIDHRALGFGYSGERMSPRLCALTCTTSLYFGLEFGRECWCGPALAPTSVKVDDGECKMRCRANRDFFCGDADRMTLYKRDGASIPDVTVPGFKSLGW